MEEKLTTYTSYRIDDTAEWKLVIYISKSGMSAYLKNVENPLEGIVELFQEKWEEDEFQLLKRIEECVYNHPQLLDDFATDIVICTDKLLWIPESAVDDEQDSSDLYCEVFPTDDENIFTDQIGDILSVYSLTEGLPSFLRRTLSGARVRNHFTILLEKFSKQISDQPTLYVDIRDGEADYLLIDDGKLLLGATHSWNNPMDIGYTVMNVFNVYGLNPREASVSISGMMEDKQHLVKTLREQISYVMLTKIPTAMSGRDIPLSALLCLARN